MKALLIVPPHQGMNGLPLGLAAIALIGFERGIFSPTILDMANEEISLDTLKKLWAVRFRDVQVVGITATTPTYRCAVETAHAIKQLAPLCFVVLGGIHATYCYESVLLNHPEIDCVVRGEGEHVFSNLSLALKEGKDISTVAGISYQTPHGPKHSPDAPLIRDLDSLPFQIDKVIERAEYRAEMFDLGKRTTSTIVGRGCSFRCTFCSESRRFGTGIRTRSVENVLNELVDLAEKGFTSVYFEDDVFTINRRWIQHFCAEMIRRRINVGWHCETRADLVDEDLLLLMKRAGCRHIFFGLESLNQEVLDRVRRGIRVERVTDAIHLCKEIGIETFISIQLGLPGDTIEGMQHTIKQLGLLPATQAGVAFTSAYPGTQMFDEYGFPLDIYERYEEPREITDWLSHHVGHGINSIHPFFMDWQAWQRSGIIEHDYDLMRQVFSWCAETIPNLWHPTQEIEPQHRVKTEAQNVS